MLAISVTLYVIESKVTLISLLACKILRVISHSDNVFMSSGMSKISRSCLTSWLWNTSRRFSAGLVEFCTKRRNNHCMAHASRICTILHVSHVPRRPSSGHGMTCFLQLTQEIVLVTWCTPITFADIVEDASSNCRSSTCTNGWLNGVVSVAWNSSSFGVFRYFSPLDVFIFEVFKDICRVFLQSINTGLPKYCFDGTCYIS